MAAATSSLPNYQAYQNWLAQQQQQSQQVQASGQPQQFAPLPTSPGTAGGATNIYGNNADTGPSYTQVGQGNTGNDENDVMQEAFNNRTYINAAGQQLNQEGEGELGYYGNMESNYDQAQASALNALAQTPGYTNDQASQIDLPYSQFNTSQAALNSQYLTPDQQSAIAGNPNAPVSTVNQGTANEGAQLNAYDANLGGELGAYQSNLGGEVANNSNYVGTADTALGTGTSSAVGALDSGLSSASSASNFSALNSAVDNPALAFDPNSTESQITPAQMQQMETAAGTTIGNQYGAAEDQLRQNAAAAGNTSPLALAAANARLQTQEASQQGQASTNAIIAANNAQYSRAAAIEAQREGAVQTQAGLQAGAATTEQSQQQNAAALAGTQGLTAAENVGQAGIGAAESVGQADINAANTYGSAALGSINNYGQAALNTQTNMTNQDYGAQSTAEQLAAQRALTLGTNQQSTAELNNQTQYNQGTNSAQLTSAGAQTVGNAQMTGQNNYRAGVAGQQSLAQGGVQNATGTQQNAYATETGGLNASTSTAANMKTGQPSVIGDIGSVAKAVLGSGGAAKGGIFTKPTVVRVGEAGPERIVKLPGYKPYRHNEDEEDSPAFREAA